MTNVSVYDGAAKENAKAENSSMAMREVTIRIAFAECFGEKDVLALSDSNRFMISALELLHSLKYVPAATTYSHMTSRNSGRTCIWFYYQVTSVPFPEPCLKSASRNEVF